MTYQLPHPLDRPYQAEVLEWILESEKKYLILNAPTGFGKSPLPAAMSIDFRTLVLVLHKSLQSANYKQQYNFEILFGKSNYSCYRNSDNQMKIPGIDTPRLTAFDCGEFDCNCPYQAQLLECLYSNRVCLNYAKFLATRDFADRYNPEILFLDEGHNLPDIITNYVGITLDYDNEFLQCNGDIRPKEESRLNYNQAMSLFRQCARACEQNKPRQSNDLRLWRKWKRLSLKINSTNEILSSGSLKDWYYETTANKLIIKPLTAKYHFKRLFNVADKIVLMSATIRSSIAERLGIGEDECDYMAVPSNWPIPTRLVYDLNGPVMNYNAWQDTNIVQDLAELISDMLSPDKSGIIHVSSKAQAHKLADSLEWSLREYGLNTYQIVIPSKDLGTEKQYQEWSNLRSPGCYCVSWNFHEGVDLGDDNINIMAKTPYTSLGSNYERARKDYDTAWYLEKAAYSMEQLFGRHQRGIAGHYGKGKLSFIADSSWHRLKSWLSEDFKKRMRNWNK
jgi:Rad3-related DNA helicase